MSFIWINRRALLLLHEESLAIHGGASGLRDEGLLESALCRPENLAAYGNPDVFDCAAAYAFGLSRNHPFIDGNKRAGFLAAGLFLRMNGFRLAASQSDALNRMLALAAGELSEADFAAWLRTTSVAR
ncbi:type II toxin-antitoxin system death-on-curing family toxin [Rhodocyclus tenuis]|uniref:Type II toxin-antitoxin system death-on-curing family toxin n=1 Tax=Rhodocyclus gracilis TaxID=2929842 RepID=A0ABX0WDI3_9RHOO|nr:type II toxin-antitoxin system death-on-curing family toxin [Rhodocyclus gracilis]MRD71799.1 type II toxin-antitoxin system death-on-curing family toxin [Rhodocyclus gracilis]NJA87807.1 type II toxin-antitoxin system death-on-curing family toxin [Rhodocyclus gracilis]